MLDKNLINSVILVCGERIKYLKLYSLILLIISLILSNPIPVIIIPVSVFFGTSFMPLDNRVLKLTSLF